MSLILTSRRVFLLHPTDWRVKEVLEMLRTSQTPCDCVFQGSEISCSTYPKIGRKLIPIVSWRKLQPHKHHVKRYRCRPPVGVMKEWQYEGLPGRTFSQPRSHCSSPWTSRILTGISREELKITYDTSLTCARYGKTSYLSITPPRPHSVRIRAFLDIQTRMLALKAILLLALLHEGNCQCGKLELEITKSLKISFAWVVLWNIMLVFMH